MVLTWCMCLSYLVLNTHRASLGSYTLAEEYSFISQREGGKGVNKAYFSPRGAPTGKLGHACDSHFIFNFLVQFVELYHISDEGKSKAVRLYSTSVWSQPQVLPVAGQKDASLKNDLHDTVRAGSQILVGTFQTNTSNLKSQTATGKVQRTGHGHNLCQ